MVGVISHALLFTTKSNRFSGEIRLLSVHPVFPGWVEFECSSLDDVLK